MQLGPKDLVERVDEERYSELYDECWGLGGPWQTVDDLPPRNPTQKIIHPKMNLQNRETCKYGYGRLVCLLNWS